MATIIEIESSGETYMADSTKQQLVKAFDLIKRDQLEEAVRVITPITQAEPENADAWWLLANAASEPRDARRALVNVLKLNPSYPKSRELLDKLNELHPPRDDELMMMMEIEEADEPLPGGGFYDEEEQTASSFDATLSDDLFTSSDIDELFSEVEEAPAAPAAKSGKKDNFGVAPGENPFEHLLEEDEAGESRRSSGRSPARTLLMVLVALVLIGGLAFVAMTFLSGDDSGDSPGNDIPADPGELAVADVNSFAADNADQLEQVRSSAEQQAQTSFGSESTASFISYDDGYAFVVRICTTPTPNLPEMVKEGIELAAATVASTPAVRDSFSMIGVSVEDCQRGDTLYRAFAPMDAAVA